MQPSASTTTTTTTTATAAATATTTATTANGATTATTDRSALSIDAPPVLMVKPPTSPAHRAVAVTTHGSPTNRSHRSSSFSHGGGGGGGSGGGGSSSSSSKSSSGPPSVSPPDSLIARTTNTTTKSSELMSVVSIDGQSVTSVPLRTRAPSSPRSVAHSRASLGDISTSFFAARDADELIPIAGGSRMIAPLDLADVSPTGTREGSLIGSPRASGSCSPLGGVDLRGLTRPTEVHSPGSAVSVDHLMESDEVRVFAAHHEAQKLRRENEALRAMLLQLQHQQLPVAAGVLAKLDTTGNGNITGATAIATATAAATATANSSGGTGGGIGATVVTRASPGRGLSLSVPASPSSAPLSGAASRVTTLPPRPRVHRTASLDVSPTRDHLLTGTPVLEVDSDSLTELAAHATTTANRCAPTGYAAAPGTAYVGPSGPSSEPTRQPSTVVVDLGTLSENARVLRSHLSPKTMLCAVLKNNAFGHGIGPVALAVGPHVDWIAIVDNWEAHAVRATGVVNATGRPTPMIRVRPALPAEVVDAPESVTEVLASYAQAFAYSQAVRRSGRSPVECHLMINIGENRMSFNLPDDMEQLVRACLLPGICVVGVMGHFACADDLDITREQLETFKTTADTIEANLTERSGSRVRLIRHVANTEATVAFPESHLDMVRVGGGFFGQESNVRPFGVRPALSWRTQVVLVREVPAGSSIGYGMAHTFKHSTIIATLPVGYGHGLPKGLSSSKDEWATHAHVLVNGVSCPIVGRISSAMTTVDVTSVRDVTGSDVRIGDPVILMGLADADLVLGSAIDTGPTAEDHAQRLGLSFDNITSCLLGANVEYVNSASDRMKRMDPPTLGTGFSLSGGARAGAAATHGEDGDPSALIDFESGHSAQTAQSSRSARSARSARSGRSGRSSTRCSTRSGASNSSGGVRIRPPLTPVAMSPTHGASPYPTDPVTFISESRMPEDFQPVRALSAVEFAQGGNVSE